MTTPIPTKTADLPNLKYGDTFTNSDGSTGTVKFDYKTGKPLTDPTLSSKDTRSTYDALGKDISDFSDSAGLSKYNDASSKLLQDQMDKMKSNYESDIGGIKTAYEEANRIQENRQNTDYAGRSTGLITSGGGFLGTTQSHEGVLQNLKDTFSNEKNALMAKRDAALQASRDAYDQKSFAMATEQLKLARDTEQELYNRQKDFANHQLDLSRENRAQKEFDLGLTDKKIGAYAAMSDESFAKLSPEQIAETDKMYYPGYTSAKRAIDKAAATAATKKEQTALDISVLNALSKIPAGRKVTLGGTTYTGLKAAAGLKDTISPLIIDQIPALAGLQGIKQEDVILSLALPTPPAWYKSYVNKTHPIPYASYTDAQIKTQWDTFRNDPGIQPFINTVRLNKAQSINASSNILNNLGISSEDIAGALSDNQD